MARARKPAETTPAPTPTLPWQIGPDGQRVYDDPTGPPKANPLTAEHYAALMRVFENMELLVDAIQRGAHVGLNVESHAAATEAHYAAAQRILAKYPQPSKSPLEL